jgi:hypothetical protein
VQLNSSHSTPLPPSESLTLLRLTASNRDPGVSPIACSSGARWRQEMAAAARGQEEIFSVVKRHQVA